MEDIKKYIHIPTGKVWDKSESGEYKYHNNDCYEYVPAEIVENGVDWKRLEKAIKQYYYAGENGPEKCTAEECKIIEHALSPTENINNNEIKEGWSDKDMIDFANFVYYETSKYSGIKDDFKDWKELKSKEKGEVRNEGCK